MAFDRIVLSGNDYLTQPPTELKTGKYKLNGTDGTSFYMNDEMLSMGLLLLGSTGCGKTTAIFQLLDQIIPQMTNQDVMVIFDSKGDFKKKYYNPLDPNHILVSTDRRDAGYSYSWNIFRELSNENGMFSLETLDMNASEISTALFRGLDSSNQPFFSIAAADFTAKLLSSMVLDAASSKDISKLNNKSVTDALSGLSNKELLDITGKYPQYRYLRSYVGDGTSTQSLGVYGNIMTMKTRNFVSIFNNGSESKTFGMRDFIRQKGKKIMFLEYNIQYADTLSVILSLLYDTAIKEALSCPGGNKWFICDEASLLPYLKRTGELLNYGRSFGCKTIFAMQSYAQLQQNYDEAEATSIAAGFCNLFAYNNNDYLSRNYVKQRCGEAFESYSFALQNITHDSYTVRDSDLRSLLTGQAFIDIKNSKTFRFQFSK